MLKLLCKNNKTTDATASSSINSQHPPPQGTNCIAGKIGLAKEEGDTYHTHMISDYSFLLSNRVSSTSCVISDGKRGCIVQQNKCPCQSKDQNVILQKIFRELFTPSVLNVLDSLYIMAGKNSSDTSVTIRRINATHCHTLFGLKCGINSLEKHDVFATSVHMLLYNECNNKNKRQRVRQSNLADIIPAQYIQSMQNPHHIEICVKNIIHFRPLTPSKDLEYSYKYDVSHRFLYVYINSVDCVLTESGKVSIIVDNNSKCNCPYCEEFNYSNYCPSLE